MKAWMNWMLRGYRDIALFQLLVGKLTGAVLDPNGSLAMAWKRIEALERQNTQLAANMLDARREAEQMQQQLSDLRRLIIAREPEKAAPKQARNWREVQRVMEEDDVPAR